MQVWVNQGVSFGPVEHSNPTPRPLNLALQKLELVCKASNFVSFLLRPSEVTTMLQDFKLRRFPVLQNSAEVTVTML